jgi:NAD(P)-dependent dehydrogenase (short-subunit alcohol dehydrogenase family)
VVQLRTAVGWADGDPAEVAAGIAFLASPEARFVNGWVFAMDAGLTAV